LQQRIEAASREAQAGTWAMKGMTDMKDGNLNGEAHFLAQLAHIECLSRENPVLDGAALVVRISHEQRICEVLVEVRLPGTSDEIGNREPSDRGRVLVFFQNAGEEPVKLRAPDFVLTAGLELPWKVGIVMATNIYRGELGEVLSWEVPWGWDDDVELLASEVVKIIGKGRAIMSGFSGGAH